MAIEDSGFGVNSIILQDNSVRSVETTSSLNIMPSLHAVFASDGPDNKIVEINSTSQMTTYFGDDFTDSDKYGLQNLNVHNVLKAGGTAYVCRLLPDDATKAHLVLKVGIKPIENIPLYKRDIYGEFILDDDGNKIPVTSKTSSSVSSNDESVVSEEGTTTETPVTVSGYKIKVFVDYASDTLKKKYPTAEKLAKVMGEVSVDPETNYKVFPLFFMSYYANGSAGNNYGFKIINDVKRDEKVSDGRRYELFLLKKTSSGASTLAIGNDLGFSFNPNAKISQYTSALEGLNTIYQNYDGASKKQIQMEIYTKNYTKLTDYITELLGEELVVNGNLSEDEIEELVVPKTAEEFDFINGISRDGVSFDNVVVDNVRPYKYDSDGNIEKDVDGKPVLDQKWVSSVDISIPHYMSGGSDGSFDTVEDEEQLNSLRNTLLQDFFNCKIDSHTITNVLKCDAGITYDANYDPSVKKSMVNILNNRRDMCIVFDCGFTDKLEEAVAYAKDIYSWITPLDGGENCAIVPHCGITVDRAVNVRVTGTYEFSYGFTRLYNRSPFAIYAGKQDDNGCVRKTIFDWVIEETIPKGYEIKLAKKNRLYWATDLGKAVSSYATDNDTERNVYFYSNASLYGESVSKLAEFRNGLICNDIRRMVKLILVKYTFDTDGADEAIRKASEELSEVLKSRYPENISITYNLYQSDRDKLLNEATCEIVVTFPDIFEAWNVKIVADRND